MFVNHSFALPTIDELAIKKKKLARATKSPSKPRSADDEVLQYYRRCFAIGSQEETLKFYLGGYVLHGCCGDYA